MKKEFEKEVYYFLDLVFNNIQAAKTSKNKTKAVFTNLKVKPNGEEVIVNPELEGTEGNLEYNNHLSDIITKYDYYNVKYCSEMYQQAINDLLDNNNTENKNKSGGISRYP